MTTPRTKRARDAANARWHDTSEIQDILRNGYTPLNPATFGKPAAPRVPFTPADPKTLAYIEARKRREAAECRAIVPISQPQTVRAELPVYQTANFKVVYTEHWVYQTMTYEVLANDGTHIGYFAGQDAAIARADECEAFRAMVMNYVNVIIEIPF